MSPFLFVIALIAGAACIIALTHITMLLRAGWRPQGQVGQRDDDGRRPDIQNNDGGTSPDFIALIDAINTQGRRNRAEERREDDAKRFREYLTIILIACTLLAISWQVYEMIHVYEPIKVQADAAKISADAAKAQADNSNDALIQAQRAWIGPINASFAADIQIGKPIEITVNYGNSGHEPGIKFISDIDQVGIFRTPRLDADKAVTDATEVCKNRMDWQGGSVVYPGSGLTGGYAFNRKTPDDFVTQHMLNGDETIVVYGCFNYRTFDKPKHSFFCFFFRNGATKISNLNICPNGHDAN